MLDRLRRLASAGPDREAPVIVVSGLPRSGTSMLMKMLEAGGVELVTDRIRQPDEDNPLGYFELEKVKELDKSGGKDWIADCRGKAVKVISWLLKDLPAGHAYKVIFMRRRLDEVIASQNKMLDRRGEPVDPANDARMMEAFAGHLAKIDAQLRGRPGFDWLDVDHRRVIEDPHGEAARVAAFLGGGVDVEQMAEAVDPALHRNRA
jgi:hypothetical protein